GLTAGPADPGDRASPAGASCTAGADEQSLLDLIHLCFDEYWDQIWFGIIIEGAVWEVAAPNPPTRDAR
ncbi:DUF7676 family protein, partial [Mycobacterium sp.]|uniref:DUF7676 family protein n=1 Tax=Mycobacterium sp. TaxID=1785 RepID=UPI003C769F99